MTASKQGQKTDSWGRPYLERQYHLLLAAAKKAETALSHAVNPPPDWDADTRKSDEALFGDALDTIRYAIAKPTDGDAR